MSASNQSAEHACEQELQLTSPEKRFFHHLFYSWAVLHIHLQEKITNSACKETMSAQVLYHTL